MRFANYESTFHPGLCLGWALWVFHAMSFCGSLSRSGGGVSFAFVTGFVAKTQAPPLLLGLRASLYRPDQRETFAVGDCYILCGRSGVSWSAWAAHRQRCERFLFAAGCSMKELAKITPSGSGCRCHGCAGSRSRNGLFCVPWVRCARAGAPSLLCEELCCHPGGRARMWLSCSSLRGYYLGAVAPRFLAAFHRFCVVARQALV